MVETSWSSLTCLCTLLTWATAAPSQVCPAYHHACRDSSECVSVAWRCDGEPDCPHGDDEENCSNTCESPLYQCSGTKTMCISPTWLCDDTEDCPGGDDEHNCQAAEPPRGCPADYTLCTGTTNNCVPLHFLCDGEADCPLGVDEDGCNVFQATAPALSCGPNQSPCRGRSSDCIEIEWLCDGETDCPEGDDEENCHGAGETSTLPTKTSTTEAVVTVSSMFATKAKSMLIAEQTTKLTSRVRPGALTLSVTELGGGSNHKMFTMSASEEQMFSTNETTTESTYKRSIVSASDAKHLAAVELKTKSSHTPSSRSTPATTMFSANKLKSESIDQPVTLPTYETKALPTMELSTKTNVQSQIASKSEVKTLTSKMPSVPTDDIPIVSPSDEIPVPTSELTRQSTYEPLSLSKSEVMPLSTIELQTDIPQAVSMSEANILSTTDLTDRPTGHLTRVSTFDVKPGTELSTKPTSASSSKATTEATTDLSIGPIVERSTPGAKPVSKSKPPGESKDKPPTVSTPEQGHVPPADLKVLSPPTEVISTVTTALPTATLSEMGVVTPETIVTAASSVSLVKDMSPITTRQPRTDALLEKAEPSMKRVLSETTMLPETTVLPDTTVSRMTTMLPETTVLPDTTVSRVTTMLPETTVLPDTRVSRVTTMLPETTVLPDTRVSRMTTMLPETTVLPDTRVSRVTTMLPETTVLPDTRVSRMTTMLPETTVLPDTTVSRMTTMLPETKVPPDTTVSRMTTILPETKGLRDTSASSVTTMLPATTVSRIKTVSSTTDVPLSKDTLSKKIGPIVTTMTSATTLSQGTTGPTNKATGETAEPYVTTNTWFSITSARTAPSKPRSTKTSPFKDVLSLTTVLLDPKISRDSPVPETTDPLKATVPGVSFTSSHVSASSLLFTSPTGTVSRVRSKSTASNTRGYDPKSLGVVPIVLSLCDKHRDSTSDSDGGTGTEILCQVSKKDKNREAPLFSYSMDGGEFNSPVVGEETSAYYLRRVQFKPVRGGHHSVICRVIDPVSGDLQQEVTQAVLVQEPPQHPPALTILGQTYRGTKNRADFTVTPRDLSDPGAVTCSTEGGYPSATVVYSGCGWQYGGSRAPLRDSNNTSNNNSKSNNSNNNSNSNNSNNSNSNNSNSNNAVSSRYSRFVCSCLADHISGCYSNSETSVTLYFETYVRGANSREEDKKKAMLIYLAAVTAAGLLIISILIVVIIFLCAKRKKKITYDMNGTTTNHKIIFTEMSSI